MAECKNCPECGGNNVVFNDRLMGCACKECGLVFAPQKSFLEKIKQRLPKRKR